jgi:hypothetical protein
MSATQLSFSLRVSSGVKSVHLLGSWDNYSGQLPLSKDKTSSKSGSWKGTFRFSSSTLEAGQRYWYYYIIDGYHVAHNPSVDSTVEPTTGRALNILDVPKSSKSSSKTSSKSSSRSHRSSGSDIPKGRPLSVSQIKAPKPVAPHATKSILDADYYDNESMEELTARFGSAGIDDDEFITDFGSSSANSSELSYRSDSSSPNSSVSGYSTPASDCSSCSCERYGITRKGDRIRIDCGGSRCGYEEESCSDSDGEYVATSANRRNGVVMRH